MSHVHNGTDMLRLLNGLARKGACLDVSGADFVLCQPGAHKRLATIAQPIIARLIVEAALGQGWLVPDGTRYRLAEAGALALHRGLTAPNLPRAETSRPVVPIEQPTPPRAKARRPPAAIPGHRVEAAERLAEDFQTGQMVPRVTSNWDRASLGAISSGSSNPSGRGVELSERISAAQERVRRALADAGPEFADVLIDLCCLETSIETFETRCGWPRRSAKLVLGLALDRLARHYGIVGRGPPLRTGRSQHWGSGDHRPM